MDGANQINAARGSPGTIPRDDQVDAFIASIADAKGNQNRGAGTQSVAASATCGAARLYSIAPILHRSASGSPGVSRMR
jgi:hypothetical protein